jgi:hypothetical protein
VVRLCGRSRRALQRLAVSDREDPFASVIRCTADPAKADKRTRSKWSRVMRYAAVYRPDSEPLDQFDQTEGWHQRVRGPFLSAPGARPGNEVKWTFAKWLTKHAAAGPHSQGPDLSLGACPCDVRKSQDWQKSSRRLISITLDHPDSPPRKNSNFGSRSRAATVNHCRRVPLRSPQFVRR